MKNTFFAGMRFQTHSGLVFSVREYRERGQFKKKLIIVREDTGAVFTLEEFENILIITLC